MVMGSLLLLCVDSQKLNPFVNYLLPKLKRQLRQSLLTQLMLALLKHPIQTPSTLGIGETPSKNGTLILGARLAKTKSQSLVGASVPDSRHIGSRCQSQIFYRFDSVPKPLL